MVFLRLVFVAVRALAVGSSPTPTDSAPVVDRMVAASWEVRTDASGNDDLFRKVAAALGNKTHAYVKARLAGFKESLQPMVASTPKNEYDRLGHAASRYLLHRVFVHRNGWFVNGLFAGQGGSTWNTSSVSELLMKFMPMRAQQAFERCLSRQGLDLDELALLAATIEDAIVRNTVEGLDIIYQVNRITPRVSIDKNTAVKIFETQMIVRLASVEATADWVDAANASIEQIYPRWPQTQEFIRKLQDEMYPGKAAFDYEAVANISRELELRWARWSAIYECRDMKRKLIKLEESAGTGCVRLAEFYGRLNNSGINDGDWQFSESPAYLRQIGAIDESEPEVPRVLIPNYLDSPANCMKFSPYYSACCVSECESLQTQIEMELQSPNALPSEIVAIARTLVPIDTLKNQHMLSSALLRRLHEIADHHAGRVPLQGRLFAQWMHFAYPRECPFPHLAGTKDPREIENTEASFNVSIVKKSQAMEFILKGSAARRSNSNGTCMHWRKEEELFVPTLHPATTSLSALEQDQAVWNSMYIVWILASFALLSARVLRTVWSARKLGKPEASEKLKPIMLV